MVRRLADLYERVRHLVPELAKFGIVGGIGAVVDLGGAAVLHSAYHDGPLKAKAISLTAATVVTYVGSRFWTFRHRENQPMAREAVLFIALNVVGLVIAEAVIAFTTYALGLRDPLAYNAASLLGTGLGTIFRFYAYRKWVFLAPAEQSAPSHVPVAAMMDVPDYPPWELDPAFFEQPMEQFPQVRLEDPFIPNGRGAPPLVSAAASTGPNPMPTSSELRAPDPRAPSPRVPGRHRKPR
jgi:putative flippase GtrA